ncbi:MAG: right-handed parallel beta-helix repeat-containing protein, partial [Planctomycetota bacterium]|nr:right-handed parallel beta-helix repeat-containing protein [Planctomycetota bacterium]
NRSRRVKYDLTLRNSSFDKNKLSGVQAEDQAHLLIEGCKFTNGAAVGFNALGCVANIKNTDFENNWHGSVVEIGSSVHFTKCDFLSNGGAGLDISGAQSLARFDTCTFDGNGKTIDENRNYDRQINVRLFGKAVGKKSMIRNGFGTGVIARDKASLELTGCKVLTNYFCGVSVWGESTASLIDCEISRNGIPKYAGGQFHGFGLDVRDNSVATVKNCLLEKNFARPIQTKDGGKVVER